MIQTGHQSLINRMAARLEREFGFHYSEQRKADLQRKLEPVVRDLGYKDLQTCLESLLSSSLWGRDVTASLVKRLTIGETYFYRDPALFALLGGHILPRLAESCRADGSELVIWSAACSSGEEPYSVAMAVDSYLPNWIKSRVRIVAVDINNVALDKARRGAYTPWSFRAMPQWLTERYFIEGKDGQRELKDHIKAMVEFRQVNLVSDGGGISELPEAQLILCRNVLIYFSAEQISTVLQRLHRKLKSGGYLFVSAPEAGCMPSDLFDLELHPGVFAARKKDKVKLRSTATAAVQPDRLVIPDSPASLQPPPPLPPPPQAELLVQAAPPVETLLAAVTNDGKSKYEEAAAAYDAGAYDKVVEILSSHDWIVDSYSAQAFHLLTNVYANQRRWSEALDTNQLAIEKSPLDPNLYYMRATILLEAGEPELCIAALRQAVFLNEEHILARIMCSSVLGMLGRPREAESQLQTIQTLLQDRKDSEVLSNCDNMSVATVRTLVTTMQCELSNRAGN